MLGQRIGNYRVLRQIGEGGMGVVYEVIRDDIGNRAAIKVLRPEFALNAETAARFFNEARAANLIEHPGIVRIFDYGQLPSGVPYLAMELLIGESLHKRLLRERRLSEPDTIRLGRQVATVLAAAHAKEVIHRDLKPENIFIVPDVEAAGGERAKILDFGIAKLAGGQHGQVKTHMNAVMGTPIYMSPEQCKGSKNVGERADVYALGGILFEMLAGRPPFIAEQAGEYIGMHLFKEPPSLKSLVPGASPGLHKIVDQMLLKDPQARPTMLAAATALKVLGNLTSDVISPRSFASDAMSGEVLAPKRSAQQARVVAPLKPLQPVTAAAPLELPADDSEVETLLLGAARARGMLPAAVRPPAENAAGVRSVFVPRKESPGVPEFGKPAPRALPADWQPVDVLAPPAPRLDNLDPDHLPRLPPKPRGRELQPRRLRVRIKQQLYRWVGLRMTGQQAPPSGTMMLRRRNAVLVIAFAVAIVVFLAVLFSGGSAPTSDSSAPSSMTSPSSQ